MSYRNDTNVTYDSSLLSSTRKPTRAEKQEGYKVDLLEESRDRRAPTPPDPGPVPTDEQPLTYGYSSGAVALAHEEGQLEKGTEPAIAEVPWYRMRWGITVIVIVIVLLIGVIVGGAVGGTHHSSRKSDGLNSGASGSKPKSSSNPSNVVTTTILTYFPAATSTTYLPPNYTGYTVTIIPASSTVIAVTATITTRTGGGGVPSATDQALNSQM